MVRVLEFVVSKQRLTKKKGCDFSNLVAGSVGYLYAKFEFATNDWDGCKKAASFWVGDQEHAALLDNNNTCLIPAEALVGNVFEVSVKGVRPKSGYEIPTSRIKVRQEVH